MYPVLSSIDFKASVGNMMLRQITRNPMIRPRNISPRWNDLEQHFSSQLSQANISPNWYIVRYVNVYYNHEPIKIMFNM